MNETKQIFIVGSSRSGTTMMGRILDNHKDIFTFQEIHFFGWHAFKKNMYSVLEYPDAAILLSKLFAIQEYGIFNQKDFEKFNDKSEKILYGRNELTLIEVYRIFLKSITNENKCKISCEQTPKNVYYIQEILDYFPNAKVIHMVRDVRDVILSQKRKWRRRFLGAIKIPLSEAIRSYFNYHPITTSKVWSSAVSHGNMFEDNPRVFKIRFEDILKNPEDKIIETCNFLGIEFNKKMVDISNIGSSNSIDKDNDLGLDASKIGKWKIGGLKKSEIYLSQVLTKDVMSKNGYTLVKFIIPPVFSIFHYITLPIKGLCAILLNINRIVNLKEYLKNLLGK